MHRRQTLTAITALAIASACCAVKAGPIAEPAQSPAGARGPAPHHACFKPGTPPEVIERVSREFERMWGIHIGFRQQTRWMQTAMGSGFDRGDPTVLTYSIVPDGTIVPNRDGTAESDLNAWLNGLYDGGRDEWLGLIQQAFEDWENRTGLTFVYEPNDDGAPYPDSPGELGVRGDIRIGATPFMGPDGGPVVAFNYYPDTGDMMLDSGDGFYDSPSNNSRALRNVISHELGHGLGMRHVCPTDNTKIMEPLITTVLDGPQTDDVLNGQRFYGDPLEHNDAPAEATSLGTLADGEAATRERVSIDGTSDVDRYAFSIGEPLTVTASATPRGGIYLEGPQVDGMCMTEGQVNFFEASDLSLAIEDASGQVVAEADAAPIGETESLTAVLNEPGAYTLVVRGDPGADRIQLYDLEAAAEFRGPTIEFAAPAPDVVTPGDRPALELEIRANNDQLAGTPTLLFRFSESAAFREAPLEDLNGGLYRAQLPPMYCGDQPQVVIEAAGVQTGTVTLPPGGQSDPLVLPVGGFERRFADDFETDRGWSVAGSIDEPGAGRWQRGVPAGADDSREADPPTDADGSGAAYLTGNIAGNSDVDGGETILVSPPFELGNAPQARIRYSRWYSNATGNADPDDRMIVEFSNDDGATWTEAEAVGPTGPGTQGGWIDRSIRIADVAAPTDGVRARFRVADTGTPSIVEAGLDAVRVEAVGCGGEFPCGADLTGPGDTPDGRAGSADFLAFINLFASGDDAADLDLPIGLVDTDDFLRYLDLFERGCAPPGP